jgi:4-carboxymuconolactone decarboxylase
LARIPIPNPDTMTADQRAVYEAVVAGPRGRVVGPLLAALHRPELAASWQEFGAKLRYGTSLPRKLNELAILATGRHWNAQIEFHIHAQAAAEARLAPDIIDAIREGRRPDFTEPAEAEIYDFTCQLLTAGRVSDAVYRKVHDRWRTVGTVELTAVIGYYSMVAMTLNAHRLPLPDGAAPPLAVPVADREAADRVAGLTIRADMLDPDDAAR